MSIYKIAKYLIGPLEGSDHLLSGKRIIGTTLAIVGCYIGIHGVKYSVDHLADISFLVGTFLMSAAAFWGLTAFADFKNQQLNTSTTLTKNEDSPDEQKTTLEKKVIPPDKSEGDSKI